MEIQNLSTSYGEEFMNELRRRANDKNLSPRDRKHWRRLLRKAEKTAE
ncbi:MAG: hypothetical protein HC843_02155 [Sphingomonadales bacterium]|nr:hypothetical protein [Sphingomonadales bacterium]